MSDEPPYPPSDPNQPGWGQPPPPPGNQPGWGQQPPPPGGQPGWGQQPPPPGDGSWGQPPPPPSGGQPGWGQQPPPPGGGWEGSPGPANYSAVGAIEYGWKAFKANPGPLLAATALVIVASAIVQGFGSFAIEGGATNSGFDVGFEFNPIGIIFNLISSLVALILGAAAIRIAFDVVDGREINLANMFNFNWLNIIIASILVSIATTIGIFLCILPGIAVLFFTYLTNYFIIAKDQDAITAIKSSVNLIKDNFGPLLVLALLSVLVGIAGLLACLIGIFVAYPVVTVATAYSFRTLQNEPVRPY